MFLKRNISSTETSRLVACLRPNGGGGCQNTTDIKIQKPQLHKHPCNRMNYENSVCRSISNEFRFHNIQVFGEDQLTFISKYFLWCFGAFKLNKYDPFLSNWLMAPYRGVHINRTDCLLMPNVSCFCSKNNQMKACSVHQEVKSIYH